jgi:hypothetical protein
MAHYAFLNTNNIVVEVIPGKDESDASYDWEQVYGDIRGLPCKRTSYGTAKGVHISGGTPYRKNYAGRGYTYDEIRDAFIPPQPSSVHILDEAACTWVEPAPGSTSIFTWNTEAKTWQS